MEKHFTVALMMHNIANLPLFLDAGGQTMFDFRTIIPIDYSKDTEGLSDYDINVKLWGTPYNSADTYIRQRDIVLFDVSDSIPYPVFEELSKMYPDRPLFASYKEYGSNEDHYLVYHNGAIKTKEGIDDMDNKVKLEIGEKVRCEGSLFSHLDVCGHSIDSDCYFTTGALLVITGTTMTPEGDTLAIVTNPATGRVVSINPKHLTPAGKTHEALAETAEAAKAFAVYSHPDAKCVEDEEGETRVCAMREVTVPEQVKSGTNEPGDARCVIDDEEDD